MKRSTITSLGLGGVSVALAVGTAWALGSLPTLRGHEAQNRAGYAIAVADVLGDANPEVIVGAPAYEAGQAPGLGQNADNAAPSGPTGQVLIYRGTPDGPEANPAIILHGEGPNDRFGTAITAADLIDMGDGRNELVISAMLASGHDAYHSGCVYVFTGEITIPAVPLGQIPELGVHDAINQGNAVELCGTQYREHFGRALAVGDFDGNGTKDLVVGAPWYLGEHGHDPAAPTVHPSEVYMAGATYFYSGPLAVGGGEIMGHMTMGEGFIANYGESLLNIGDLDPPSGSEELLVWAAGAGAHGHANPGLGYLVTWDPGFHPDGDVIGFDEPRIVIEGTSTTGRGNPALIGDLDGDGFSEIAVPTRAGPNGIDTTNAGGLYIMRGNLLAPPFSTFDHADPIMSRSKLADVSLAAITGAGIEDKFGWAAAKVGDSNLDQVVDFAVGAPWADGILRASEIAGRVYIISGKSLTEVADQDHARALTFKIGGNLNPTILTEYAGTGNDLMGQTLVAGSLTSSLPIALLMGSPDHDADPTVDMVTDIPGTNSNENSGAVFIHAAYTLNFLP